MPSPGWVKLYCTVIRPSMPPLPSRSWPRRPTELNTHSFGRMAIARCHVNIRSASGPDSVQVSPTFKWQGVSGRPPTWCCRVGLRPVDRVGDEVVDLSGDWHERGLRTRGHDSHVVPLLSVAALRLPLQNSVEKCHGAWRGLLRVELSDEDQAFQDELRAFLAARGDRRGHPPRPGDRRELRRGRPSGARRQAGTWPPTGRTRPTVASARCRRRIWDLEIGRAHTPWFHWGTTAMVAHRREPVRLGRAEGRGAGHRCCPATTGCAWATPNLKVARTSRRARRARCATATAGSSTAPRCSRPTRTTPSTSS